MHPTLPEAQALIDAFFLEDDERLAESLREMRVLEGAAGMLADVCGLTGDTLLARLERLGVTPAGASALMLVPLLATAWADGRISETERVALIRSLDKILFFQTIDRDLVDCWLGREFPPSLVDLWERLARRLGTDLTAEERRSLADQVLARASLVANAAGRVLGFGGASKAETAVLARLEGALL